MTGYLWPTGERGSGKTQFLTLFAELGYLGTLMQIGGTFASLRDLSDYGALLCFDDAENLSDPKTDPDKRALLLAGNRKGVTRAGEGVGGRAGLADAPGADVHAPLLLGDLTPDSVLASRSILVPLVRTATGAGRTPTCSTTGCGRTTGAA